MSKRKYTNVALPTDFVERIDKFISKTKLGFRSRGELVKEAVREILHKYKDEEE